MIVEDDNKKAATGSDTSSNQTSVNINLKRNSPNNGRQFDASSLSKTKQLNQTKNEKPKKIAKVLPRPA